MAREATMKKKRGGWPSTRRLMIDKSIKAACQPLHRVRGSPIWLRPGGFRVNFVATFQLAVIYPFQKSGLLHPRRLSTVTVKPSKSNSFACRLLSSLPFQHHPPRSHLQTAPPFPRITFIILFPTLFFPFLSVWHPAFLERVYA